LENIANTNWQEIPNHFPDIFLDEYTVMPNHFHGIIGIDILNENPIITDRQKCYYQK
jgi:hypothetical protein